MFGDKGLYHMKPCMYCKENPSVMLVCTSCLDKLKRHHGDKYIDVLFSDARKLRQEAFLEDKRKVDRGRMTAAQMKPKKVWRDWNGKVIS